MVTLFNYERGDTTARFVCQLVRGNPRKRFSPTCYSHENKRWRWKGVGRVRPHLRLQYSQVLSPKTGRQTILIQTQNFFDFISRAKPGEPVIKANAHSSRTDSSRRPPPPGIATTITPITVNHLQRLCGAPRAAAICRQTTVLQRGNACYISRPIYQLL